MQIMFDGQDRPVPADSYPVVWLQLRVQHVGHLPTFAAAIPSVIEHARSFPGMVRFGFDIDWERNTFRTFGAFDSEASLRAYVADGAHGAVYRRLRGRLGESCATYGTIPAKALPTTWDDIPDACFTKSQALQHRVSSPYERT